MTSGTNLRQTSATSNMPATANLVGQRFKRLLVVKLASSRPILWLCRCDCGNERLVPTRNLRNSNTKSCGCLQRDVVRQYATIHGATADRKRTSEYRSWRHMIERCYNPNIREWKYWGGAGVQVCPQWRHNFQQFLHDMGPRPVGHSIDRYPDKNGHYEPGNCRWATPTEQTRNRRPRTPKQATMSPTAATIQQ